MGDVQTWRVAIPTADGHRGDAVLHRPARPDNPGWLVWAHGGSWHHGSAETWAGATANLARLTGVTVLSVNYRLAPESRHPDALIDMLAAIAWVRSVDPLGVISVGGDSVGGTLAAAAAVVARDRREPLRAQILAYPPYDPECRAPSYFTDPAGFPDPLTLRAQWRDWLGDPTRKNLATDGTRLRATPRDAPSLAGVCPAVLAVGSLDPVRDDVEAYASDLRGAGVLVRLSVLPGIRHGDILTPHSRILHTLAEALTLVHRPTHTERNHTHEH
ncbi:alpha/beta hydrolase [Mycetocola tolaasinivorans]|uniref:Alpha/beta hydrolase n=1 Tax=Mycetocola tolaasinivorans TaxID=76635 RepID=A0A3L7A9C1_9MICO|nr:alpha/beta hydrolase fold domain-containing protein [Mycetocola tolaasinivorans]RLP76777.1 alpha/beta hydrolase [Mycetocola tolaasinivorans]